MEDVSTRVLGKIKNIKKVKPKNDLMYQDIYNCICQNTQKKIRFIIHYVKPTAQLLFKIRFPKGGHWFYTTYVKSGPVCPGSLGIDWNAIWVMIKKRIEATWNICIHIYEHILTFGVKHCKTRESHFHCAAFVDEMSFRTSFQKRVSKCTRQMVVHGSKHHSYNQLPSRFSAYTPVLRTTCILHTPLIRDATLYNI